VGNSTSINEPNKNPTQTPTRTTSTSNRKHSVGASSSTPTPTTATSLKFIPKNQSDLSNLLGTFVSVNFIDVEATNKSSIEPSSSLLNNQINVINTTSFKTQQQKQLSKNSSNNQENHKHTNQMPSNQHAHQPSQSHNIWHDESASAWTSTGVMSDRSSVYSIDDGVCSFLISLVT